MEKGTTRLIRRLLDRRRDPDDLRPIRRGTARRYLGRLYYKGRRYLLWASGRIRFAREQRTDRLPCLHVSHESPLIRVLKDVDMGYQYNKITNLRIAAARQNKTAPHTISRATRWKERRTERVGSVFSPDRTRMFS